MLYFGGVYALESLGEGRLWKPWLRGLLADYAYPINTIFWTGFSHIPGRLKRWAKGIARSHDSPAVYDDVPPTSGDAAHYTTRFDSRESFPLTV